MEALLGTHVVNDKKEKIEVASFCGAGKYVGVYFSAHWCPPCRQFTPVLSEFYKKFKKGPKGGELEIVFASSDRDQEAFDDYFSSMPWLALDYADRDTKAKLSEKFGIRGIPTFLVFDSTTGEVVQAQGRAKVTSDPDGNGFPWKE